MNKKQELLTQKQHEADAALKGLSYTQPLWWRRIMRAWALSARCWALSDDADLRLAKIRHALQQAEFCRWKALELERGNL